jgi:hypothetical protein
MTLLLWLREPLSAPRRSRATMPTRPKGCKHIFGQLIRCAIDGRAVYLFRTPCARVSTFPPYK